MAIRYLNGEFPPSDFELSQAPAALDQETRNGHSKKPQVSREVLGRFARDYKRTVDSLQGADRDKRRAESKLLKRAERAAEAGNDNAVRSFRAKIQKMQRRGQPGR